MNKYCKIVKPILIILILMALYIMINTDERNNESNDCVKVGEEEISIFYDEKDAYLFLPSYAEVADVYKDIVVEATKPNILQGANLPSVFISTRSASMDNIYQDSKNKESGSIRIYAQNGEKEFSGALKSIQGRGNYSWTNWDKKSFSIDVGKSNSLLGLNQGGNYALIANASDPTLVRNEIARQMEAAVGMEVTTVGKFVDLYINGEYTGVYYLCPTVSIAEERVNIYSLEDDMDRMYSKTGYTGFDVYETSSVKGWNLQEEPEDYSGGYLIEREFKERYRTEYSENASGFVTGKGECFVVKSPKYCSKYQINYLSNYFDEVEQTIMDDRFINPNSQKALEEYVDITSFAKWYLIGEVTKNYDAGVSSAYFYKDSDTVDGKLKLASGWDYDMSMGNYLDWMEYYNQSPEGLTKLYSVESSSNWYYRLYEYGEFYDGVLDIYSKNLLPYINTLIESGIEDYRCYLEKSSEMDRIRWHDMYEEKGYSVGDEEEYKALVSFLECRRDYLSRLWINK